MHNGKQVYERTPVWRVVFYYLIGFAFWGLFVAAGSSEYETNAAIYGYEPKPQPYFTSMAVWAGIWVVVPLAAQLTRAALQNKAALWATWAVVLLAMIVVANL